MGISKGFGLIGANRVGAKISELSFAIAATIDGTGGDDSIVGTKDGDEITTGAGRDTIRGHDGDDSIFSGQNADSIFGARGNDFIYADNGDDYMEGNDGDDTLGGVNGNDTLNGGNGSDWGFYTHFDRSDKEGEGVTIDLSLQGTAQDTGGQGVDTLISIENILGSNVNDSITGDANDNFLVGNTGTDTISGGDGNDLVFGDSGTSNLLAGGAGDDTVQGGGSLDGGDGNDLLVGQGDSATVNGGLGDDFAQGAFGADIINGGDGDDQLVANGGNDTVDGGAGDDLVNVSIAFDLIGVTGDGTYVGGEGTDTLSFFDTYFFGYDGGVKFNLSKPSPQQTAIGNITSSGFENLVGSVGAFMEPGGNDTLIGNDGDNAIYGGWGNDILRGGAGNDFLYGDHYLLPGIYVGLPQGTTFTGDGAINGSDIAGLFDDKIVGGGGNDTLWGSEGTDTMNGGRGNDVFLYTLLSDSDFDNPDDDEDNGPDRILGFDATNDDGTLGDRIDVSAIDAVTDVDGDDTTTGDQSFTLVGSFTGTAGEVVTGFDEENSQTFVKFDVDGDAVADMVIILNGDHTDITQDNFVA